MTVDADITGETKESTETENGEIKYTETVMFDDTNYTGINTMVLSAAGIVSPKAVGQSIQEIKSGNQLPLPSLSLNFSKPMVRNANY